MKRTLIKLLLAIMPLMALAQNTPPIVKFPFSPDSRTGDVSGNRQVPYATVAAANASPRNLKAYRFQGLQVTVGFGLNQKQYWYVGGVEDSNLVAMPIGGGTVTFTSNGMVQPDSLTSQALRYTKPPIYTDSTLTDLRKVNSLVNAATSLDGFSNPSIKKAAFKALAAAFSTYTGFVMGIGDSLMKGVDLNNPIDSSFFGMLGHDMQAENGQALQQDIQTDFSASELNYRGITLSGSTGVAYGPNGRGLVMFDGSSLSLSDNINQFDFWIGKSNMGDWSDSIRMEFYKDGVKYRTEIPQYGKTYSTWDSTKITGGFGAMHTYTLKVVGSYTGLRIYGLMRLKPIDFSYGKRPVFFVRNAHEGWSTDAYSETGLYYGLTDITGITTNQKGAYIIALGTNDINSSPDSVFRARTDTLLAHLTATGNDVYYIFPPFVQPAYNNNSPKPWNFDLPTIYEATAKRLCAKYNVPYMTQTNVDYNQLGFTNPVGYVHYLETGHIATTITLEKGIAEYYKKPFLVTANNAGTSVVISGQDGNMAMFNPTGDGLINAPIRYFGGSIVTTGNAITTGTHTVYGALQAQGGLGVYGSTTLQNGLNVYQGISCVNDFNGYANGTFSGTLGVGGALSSASLTTGAINATSVNATGTGTFYGVVNAQAGLTVYGATSLQNGLNVYQGITSVDAINGYSALTINGLSALNGGVSTPLVNANQFSSTVAVDTTFLAFKADGSGIRLPKNFFTSATPAYAYSNAIVATATTVVGTYTVPADGFYDLKSSAAWYANTGNVGITVAYRDQALNFVTKTFYNQDGSNAVAQTNLSSDFSPKGEVALLAGSTVTFTATVTGAMTYAASCSIKLIRAGVYGMAP